MTTTPPPGDLSQFGTWGAVLVVLLSGLFAWLQARTRSAPQRTRGLRTELRQTRKLFELAMGYIHRLRAAYARDTGRTALALPRELRDDPQPEETPDDRTDS